MARLHGPIYCYQWSQIGFAEALGCMKQADGMEWNGHFLRCIILYILVFQTMGRILCFCF